MLDNHIEDRLIKLEKQNKHLKLLIFSLIVMMLLSLIALLLYIQSKGITDQTSSQYDKDFRRLEASIRSNEAKIAELQKISDNSQEYKNTINNLNSEYYYLEETIGQLIKPNLFSPWHIYDGRAGIWFIDEKGEEKWLPNTSLEELTFLLDRAIRNGFTRQPHKEDTIQLFIYLDEEGPEEYITIDLNNNKIFHRNEQYSITKYDMEVLKTYFNEKGIDTDSR